MKEMLKYWLWLGSIKGLGTITSKKLLEVFKNPEEIYYASKEQLKTVPGIGGIIADEIIASRTLDLAQRMLEKMDKLNIAILTIADPLYPLLVKKLSEAPIVLYYKGTLKKDSMGVAIVGARRCTGYGKRVANEAATYLAVHGVPVISGMAKGIDGYAHTACIKAEGYTLAFLGHGLDICYPKEHQGLMDAIIENGAVISEYPPGTPVRQVHFPQRNYLISAWAHKLLVVEAGANSGALITAKLAKEQQKKVLAVPNNIYSKESQGTNLLIADGAEIYLNASQLIEQSEIVSSPTTHSELSIVSKAQRRKVEAEPEANPMEEKIITELKKSNKSIEELAVVFGKDKLAFLDAISTMEIEGKIRRLPGGKIKV